MTNTVHRLRRFGPTVCFSALLALGGGTAAAADRARNAGEKIEFTAPSEVGPVRPLQGFEMDNRRFGLGRGDSDSVASQLPPGSPLPAPEDVNRLRLLQQMFERRLGISSGLTGDPGSTAVSLDDPDGLGSRATGTGMGIDDLFERSSSARDRRGSDSGLGSFDRSSEDGMDRRREDSWSRANDNGDGREAAEIGGRRDFRRGDEATRTGRDEGFLPTWDNRGLLGRDQGSGRSGRTEGFLDSGSVLNRRGSMRDLDDAASARRAQRLEEWNRLLGRSNPGPERTGVGGAVGASPSGRPGNGVTSVPGTAVPGAGPSRSALDTMGPRGPEASVPSSATTADLPVGGLARPAGLDLGLGRGSARSSANGTGLGVSSGQVRPMELFRQKHDNQIPMRGF